MYAIMAIAETCNRGEEGTLRASAGQMDIQQDTYRVWNFT